MGKLSKKTLNKVFLRSQTCQFSHNYERMQSLSFTYLMSPALKELYKDKTKEEKVNMVHRHLEYFNTHPIAIPLIAGVTLAMEEKTNENEKDLVTNIKAGLMGPFAGLGDSMLNLTWYPIAGSIGASLCVANGSIVGPLVMFLIINILYWPLKYYGLHKGYQKGIDILEGEGGNTIFDRLSNFANVMGLVVVGALIPNTVKVMTAIQFEAGEGVINLQESLDSVMPSLLSVIVVFICYKFLKKSEGKHTAALILTVLIVSTILVSVGILG
ncbi:MAG: PTS system mannose/fructose/sorbose family transporter subunit IID [Tissierellia bacterium]|nr:PTS system mannose/fructose/sorbose family transporter subunit IID [Tissierellia bacterium]